MMRIHVLFQCIILNSALKMFFSSYTALTKFDLPLFLHVFFNTGGTFWNTMIKHVLHVRGYLFFCRDSPMFMTHYRIFAGLSFYSMNVVQYSPQTGGTEIPTAASLLIFSTIRLAMIAVPVILLGFQRILLQAPLYVVCLPQDCRQAFTRTEKLL